MPGSEAIANRFDMLKFKHEIGKEREAYRKMYSPGDLPAKPLETYWWSRPSYALKKEWDAAIKEIAALDGDEMKVLMPKPLMPVIVRS